MIYSELLKDIQENVSNGNIVSSPVFPINYYMTSVSCMSSSSKELRLFHNKLNYYISPILEIVADIFGCFYCK